MGTGGHLVTLHQPSGSSKLTGSEADDKILIPILSDPFPPTRLLLLKVLPTSHTGSPTGDQMFTHRVLLETFHIQISSNICQALSFLTWCFSYHLFPFITFLLWREFLFLSWDFHWDISWPKITLSCTGFSIIVLVSQCPGLSIITSSEHLDPCLFPMLSVK